MKQSEVVTATAMTGAQLAGTIEEVVVTAMRADVPEMMIVKGSEDLTAA